MHHPGSTPDRFLLGLLGMSLCLNLILGSAFLRTLRLPADRTDKGQLAQPLAPGTHVPPIEAFTPEGERREVRFDGENRSTVIYVHAPGCYWCRKNAENIQFVMEAAPRFRYISLSLQAEAQFNARKPVLQVQSTLIRPSAATIRAYRLGATPQTIVVTSQGVVERVWLGAFTGAIGKEVEDYFGIKLPGLQQ